MARCRIGAGEGEGDCTISGVRGVRAPGGSSRARASQNSSFGTTVNATQHRNSMQYFELYITNNAYKTPGKMKFNKDKKIANN
jgi:hypothetical protein